jgi:hypothetical protein
VAGDGWLIGDRDYSWRYFTPDRAGTTIPVVTPLSSITGIAPKNFLRPSIRPIVRR